MPVAVIDTCVIVDMLLESRPRHREALRLRREMRRVGARARIPTFALFEFHHAIRQERRISGAKMQWSADPGAEFGVGLELVNIDEAFAKRYLDLDLPEIRAGDLVFAAIAKGEGLPLITEDLPFAKVAAKAGIRVLSTAEYADELAGVTV